MFTLAPAEDGAPGFGDAGRAQRSVEYRYDLYDKLTSSYQRELTGPAYKWINLWWSMMPAVWSISLEIRRHQSAIWGFLLVAILYAYSEDINDIMLQIWYGLIWVLHGFTKAWAPGAQLASREILGTVKVEGPMNIGLHLHVYMICINQEIPLWQHMILVTSGPRTRAAC